MNMSEKIAATYLRLNGFLLLPQFTVFIDGEHGHVDLVGLRAKGSSEESAGLTFLIDDKFFNAIDPDVCKDPRNEFLGVVRLSRFSSRKRERCSPGSRRVCMSGTPMR